MRHQESRSLEKKNDLKREVKEIRKELKIKGKYIFRNEDKMRIMSANKHANAF